MAHVLILTQKVLNRMKIAHSKNRGIRISADELKEMSLSIFGELWDEDDPSRDENEE